jgi:hypothetical protein
MTSAQIVRKEMKLRNKVSLVLSKGRDLLDVIHM